MAKAGKALSDSSARRTRKDVGALGPPQDRELMVKLAAELQQFSQDLQTEIGLRPEEIRRATKIAAQRARPKLSAEVLEQTHSLARLLEVWQRSSVYRAEDGSPKVLPIHGKGYSFERLLKEFAPGISIEDALTHLIARSDVRVIKGQKVAILGSVAVMYPRTPEVLLAAITVRLRRLCRTMIDNSKNPSKATGLYDRQVTGRFTTVEWAKFSQSIRNQLDDLVVHVNELSEDRPGKKDDKHNCGMSVFLWED
jgi:hypothetical protein